VGKKIELTFKPREKEMDDYIHSFPSPTAHIKELLQKEMNEKKEVKSQTLPTTSKKFVDDVDL
jgi:hypothetical protein